MSVIGWVQAATWQPLGSELTDDVAAGQVAIPVEWGGQFDDDGGTVLINGVQYTYSKGAIVDGTSADAPDVITLDTALVANATVGDVVAVYSGGQVLRDLVATVSIGTQDAVGDDVEVVIPFVQRGLWPEGQYEEPVQVVLSDDMERIEDTPGRTPAYDNGLTYVPRIKSVLVAGLVTPSGGWWASGIWQESESVGFLDSSGTGFVARESGLYVVHAAVTFDTDGTGVRGIRLTLQGDPERAQLTRALPSNPSTVETSQVVRLVGDYTVLQVNTFQDSGGSLNLWSGADSAFNIYRIAP